jgi:hypothetical protein
MATASSWPYWNFPFGYCRPPDDAFGPPAGNITSGRQGNSGRAGESGELVRLFVGEQPPLQQTCRERAGKLAQDDDGRIAQADGGKAVGEAAR